MTGVAKLSGIIDFIDTLFENRSKFIIFAHHLEVLSGLEDAIIRRKMNYIRIDGSIEITKRHEAVHKF